MAAHFLACAACARHIRVDEAQCPFCGVTCPESFASSPAPGVLPLGLTRAGLARFGARTAAAVGGGMALAVAVACSPDAVPEPPYGGAP
jgi:hypothetical protein